LHHGNKLHKRVNAPFGASFREMVALLSSTVALEIRHLARVIFGVRLYTDDIV
jgi:hypothetical protein